MPYLEIWLTPQYIMSLITLGRIYGTALAEVNNLVILTEKTNVIVCKEVNNLVILTEKTNVIVCKDKQTTNQTSCSLFTDFLGSHS